MGVWTKFAASLLLLLGLSFAAIVAIASWSNALVRFAFVPHAAFTAQSRLPDGAYEDDTMWLSRPGPDGHRNPGDPAGLIPSGWTDPPGPPARAEVFFVPTTTSFASHHWNDAIEQRDGRSRDRLFVGLMASAFNRGEVWAPLYRQAVIGAFLTSSPSARAAIDVGYRDVRDAFDTFVSATPADRPIVLAGHGQGALLALRLLRERVARTPLERRLVAVYAIGWPVARDGVEAGFGLPACTAPEQPGCLIDFISFAEPADPALLLLALRDAPLPGTAPAGLPLLCTNPLTGDETPVAPASVNLGTLHPDAAMTGGKIERGRIGARCDARGLLLIGSPPAIGGYVLPGNNYTMYDIPLFWANLRADMARRERGWYARRSKVARRPVGSASTHG